MQKKAVIIGAGPAGLTAAFEFVTKTDIIPVIIEKSGDIGGISKTVVYNGNRIDIGGHRFFSKSDTVMNWWKEILPLQGACSRDECEDMGRQPSESNTRKLTPGGPDPEKSDRVMLIRSRLSRIFFLRKFFDYPITLNGRTLSNLGLFRIFKIGFTYLRVRIFPFRNPQNLEQFFISRFGTELYKTFFKDYTEKVWGVRCAEISAEWGAQRIKELSVSKAIKHAIRSAFRKSRSIEQKDTETSLIELFMYPKLGPGQMWETVAALIREKGGEIHLHSNVEEIIMDEHSVREVVYQTSRGERVSVSGDYFFSTMPVKELISSMNGSVPSEVKTISEGLQYRDFITVGLLLEKMKLKNKASFKTETRIVPDNWIYIQEREVKIGRLQIFNNWSPYMVSDPKKVWIGLEYFCNEGDSLWEMNDADFIRFAIDELASIDIIEKEDVLDSTIIRMPKTYPAYFGTYDRFSEIRNFTDGIENLFLVGRNGMHRYNNQDHSMLTAITAVENIIQGVTTKDNLWDINTEVDYHEEKKISPSVN